MGQGAHKHTWSGIVGFSLWAGLFGAVVALVVGSVIVLQGWLDASVLDMCEGIGLAFAMSFALTFFWLSLWLLSERLRNREGS